ncbi:MAG: hypothetical protein NT006_05775 [Candidatus Aminicenantes bacterium]|nr:hypothetical protein [Candidatus Aminicenantes bacterium]
MTSGLLIAISLIAYFALRQLIKNSDTSITITTIGLFLLFCYTPIFSFLGECARRVAGGGFVRHRFIMPLTIVLATCLSLWALRNKKHSKVINAYFSLLFAALLIYNIFAIFGVDRKSKQGEAVQARVENTGSVASVERITLGYKPDIYFILLDSYCSPASLRKYWHVDNSRFEDHLKELGFFIAEDSISAYDSTIYSLSSTLNMSSYDDQISGTDAFGLIEKNSFTKKLIENGYKFINLSIFDIWGNRKYYDSSYFNEAANLAERILMDSLIGVVKAQFIDVEKALNAQQLIVKELMDLPGRRKMTQRPIFAYAHLMITHPPAFLDREGKRRTFGLLSAAGYKQQIEYAGKVISSVIDRILTSSSRPPIVILQGDHGSRIGKKEWRQKEQFSVLNAIYLPKNDYALFSENISPPATLKLVAAQYLNEETPIR